MIRKIVTVKQMAPRQVCVQTSWEYFVNWTQDSSLGYSQFLIKIEIQATVSRKIGKQFIGFLRKLLHICTTFYKLCAKFYKMCA